MRHTQSEERRRAEVLGRLRTEMARLESCYAATNPAAIHLTSTIDNCFEKGAVPLGTLHEFLVASREQDAAASGLVAGLVSKLPKTLGLIWITRRRTVFPPGLKTFGIEPDRIIFIEPRSERDTLWATEEALRCKAIGAVIADIANIDLTSSRRLQLAAEQSGAGAFLLRLNAKSLSSSACASRWQVKHAASFAPDGLPGVGFARWDVELLKVRNGRTGRFTLEWRGDEFFDVSETPIRAWQNPLKAGAA